MSRTGILLQKRPGGTTGFKNFDSTPRSPGTAHLQTVSLSTRRCLKVHSCHPCRFSAQAARLAPIERRLT